MPECPLLATKNVLFNFFTVFHHVSDSVYVMCFSLILLSVDLTSPHVKNKMSKREFIRNTRNAVEDTDGGSQGSDLFGEL